MIEGLKLFSSQMYARSFYKNMTDIRFWISNQKHLSTMTYFPFLKFNNENAPAETNSADKRHVFNWNLALDLKKLKIWMLSWVLILGEPKLK